MKTCFPDTFCTVALVAGLGLAAAARLPAQTLTVLHNFTPATAPTNSSGWAVSTNTDGLVPFGTMVLSSNVLYGTLEYGGSAYDGTVFKINTDGSGFQVLHDFTMRSGSYTSSGLPNSYSTNSDGANPAAGLVLSGNTLYGAAQEGGIFSFGTLFKINTDGTGFTVLHSFGYSDGAYAWGTLALSGNTLYGTTTLGGPSNSGTVFKINTDGTGFSNLYNFTDGNDGGRPYAGVTIASNVLYGTTYEGGVAGVGAIYKLNTDGSGFTTLHSFGANNTEGNQPYASLISANNVLYGTTLTGNYSYSSGTVFRLNTDGTGFTNLHVFGGGSGTQPFGGVILSGSTLFGVASQGGTNNSGVIFKVNVDGTGFSDLYLFSPRARTGPPTNYDGFMPMGSLAQAGNTFYGGTQWGGSNTTGVIFSLVLPSPQLTVTPSGPNLIVSWPTNVPGLTLQAATNYSSPTWTDVTLSHAIVNGRNTVTDSLSGVQKFYRLVP